MAAGTKTYPPAPVSLVSFTCSITTIATRSRCWLYPATSRRKAQTEQTDHESSASTSGRYGDLYRQKQNTAEAGVAEERRAGGRSCQPLQDRPHASPFDEERPQ